MERESGGKIDRTKLAGLVSPTTNTTHNRWKERSSGTDLCLPVSRPSDTLGRTAGGGRLGLADDVAHVKGALLAELCLSELAQLYDRQFGRAAGGGEGQAGGGRGEEARSKTKLCSNPL